MQFLIVLVIVKLASSFRSNSVGNKLHRNMIHFAADEDEKTVIVPITADVQDVLDRIVNLLSTKAPSSPDFVKENGISLDTEQVELKNTLDRQYEKMLADIRGTALTEVEKSSYFNIIMKEIKTTSEAPSMDTGLVKTRQFCDDAAPYCIIYGTGAIGQRLKNSVKDMGKAVEAKFAEGNALATMPENEINFIVKGAKTIILAADNKPPEQKGGWFGSDSNDEFSCISAKGLKRLLNAAMNERNKAAKPYNVCQIGIISNFYFLI